MPLWHFWVVSQINSRRVISPDRRGAGMNDLVNIKGGQTTRGATHLAASASDRVPEVEGPQLVRRLYGHDLTDRISCRCQYLARLIAKKTKNQAYNLSISAERHQVINHHVFHAVQAVIKAGLATARRPAVGQRRDI
jgi:hypothetical protein